MSTEKLHKLCYQPGVVMYVDDDNICRDMEVSPEVSVLHIGEQKKPSKTNPPLLLRMPLLMLVQQSGRKRFIQSSVMEDQTEAILGFKAGILGYSISEMKAHKK